MGTEQKVKLEQIIGIFEAIRDVETNTKLETNIAYRLGRLSDRCKSIIRVFEKLQNQAKNEMNDQILKLRADFESKSDSEKAKINKEIRDANETFSKKIEEMLEQEETIKIPEFQLKDFEGKGVSIKFFTGMGEFIKE